MARNPVQVECLDALIPARPRAPFFSYDTESIPPIHEALNSHRSTYPGRALANFTSDTKSIP